MEEVLFEDKEEREPRLKSISRDTTVKQAHTTCQCFCLPRPLVVAFSSNALSLSLTSLLFVLKLPPR